MHESRDLPSVLQLEPLGEGRYRIENAGDPDSRDVVFGGQFLAQMIMAAVASSPGKKVRSLHTIFARTARVGAPTELDVETMHDGRSFGSCTVTVWQGDRLCVRALALLDTGDPDLLRHGVEMPKVPDPDESAAGGGMVFPGGELEIVGGVDTSSPDAPIGPAELFIWTRYADAPDDVAVNQAVLAWATDGLLIGTAMRPHAGIGLDQAHRTISTGVISHTLTFHEPFTTRDWLLMAQESPHAGEGRTYGRGQVFTRDGRLVASYVQDNMIRAVPEDGVNHRTGM